MSISQTNENVNILSTVRENATRKEIVQTVREQFPRFSFDLYDKCEHSDVYGVELRREAVESLRTKFGSVKAKKKRRDGHKLKKRLACRVNDDIFDAVQDYVTFCEGGTVNDLIIKLLTARMGAAYNWQASRLAQIRFCERHDAPIFVPRDGICPRCQKDVYGKNGYSVMLAATWHITSCPFCRASFCE